MSTPPPFYDWVHTFSAPGSKTVEVPGGSGIMLNRVSETSALVTFKVGSAVYDLLPSQPNPVEFDRVTFTTDTACTIRVRFAQDGFQLLPPAQTEGSFSISGAVSSKPSSDGLTTTTDVSQASGSTVLILASNANRDKVLLQRVDAVSSATRVGDSNTGASRGISVPEDGSLEITSQGAIYGYQASGSTMTWAILEEITA